MKTHREWVVGFDADDTLWHNETIFEKVHERYRTLLASYHDAATVDKTLTRVELQNLDLYGYGIKGFTLSAIETAIELTQGRISGQEVRQLVDLGREMLEHPVELLDGVADVIPALAKPYSLLLITKGDLKDQERKLAKSGLAAHFAGVEVISEKDVSTYAAVFRRHSVDPERFVMVGNSAKSDVIPVLELGASALYIPYHLTWAAERVEAVPHSSRLLQLDTIRQVPAELEQLIKARRQA
jgi:putative hydrolase of the HAD superfamily